MSLDTNNFENYNNYMHELPTPTLRGEAASSAASLRADIPGFYPTILPRFLPRIIPGISQESTPLIIGDITGIFEYWGYIGDNPISGIMSNIGDNVQIPGIIYPALSPKFTPLYPRC